MQNYCRFSVLSSVFDFIMVPQVLEPLYNNFAVPLPRLPSNFDTAKLYCLQWFAKLFCTYNGSLLFGTIT